MKAVIIGNGTSGKSANKLMKKLGYQTFVVDDKKTRLTQKLCEKLLFGLDILVLSPGVSSEHVLVREAKEKNIEVVSEFEVGARLISSKVIAITGTNGKTTTVSLTGELLQKEGRHVYVGGNIGTAVSSFCAQVLPEDITVLEASSFQLENILHFHPHIAVFLNISPDHLNRHKTMQNYINAKMRIFEKQTEKDFAVLNLDDKPLMEQDFTSLRSEIYYFSTKKECKGCYVKRGCIYFSDGVTSVFVMRVKDIPLAGDHNISNVLASLLACILAGEKIKDLPPKVKAFKGVSHRLEYVCEVNGVTFINDSKATNVSSTMVALRAMNEPTTLILGGSDKGFDFDQLFGDLPPIVKNVVAIGETASKILHSANKFNISNVFYAKSFKEGVRLAFDLASFGEVVLLSPACASFDMFKNFEERGKVFIKIVRELEKSENRKIRNKKGKKIQA